MSPLRGRQLDPIPSVRTGRLDVDPKETGASTRLVSGRVLGYEGIPSRCGVFNYV